MNLDLSFLTWEVFRGYVLNGLIFSVQLTLIAMVGGIALGTVLALMRLSGKRWLEVPAATYVDLLRSIPLVMVIMWFFLIIPFLIGRPIGAEPGPGRLSLGRAIGRRRGGARPAIGDGGWSGGRFATRVERQGAAGAIRTATGGAQARSAASAGPASSASSPSPSTAAVRPASVTNSTS